MEGVVLTGHVSVLIPTPDMAATNKFVSAYHSYAYHCYAYKPSISKACIYTQQHTLIVPNFNMPKFVEPICMNG